MDRESLRDERKGEGKARARRAGRGRELATSPKSRSRRSAAPPTTRGPTRGAPAPEQPCSPHARRARRGRAEPAHRPEHLARERGEDLGLLRAVEVLEDGVDGLALCVADGAQLGAGEAADGGAGEVACDLRAGEGEERGQLYAGGRGRLAEREREGRTKPSVAPAAAPDQVQRGRARLTSGRSISSKTLPKTCSGSGLSPAAESASSSSYTSSCCCAPPGPPRPAPK